MSGALGRLCLWWGPWVRCGAVQSMQLCRLQDYSQHENILILL